MSNYKPSEQLLKELGFKRYDKDFMFLQSTVFQSNLWCEKATGIIHISGCKKFNIQSDSDLITFLKIIKPRKELDL